MLDSTEGPDPEIAVPAGGPSEPPTTNFEKINAYAQISVAASTFFALLVIITQTFISRQQLDLQEETSNRAWTGVALATVYSQPPLPLHVHQKARLAYLLLKRDGRKLIRLPRADLTGIDLVMLQLNGGTLPEVKFM